MPLKSKSQQRWMFWAESQDKLPKGTAKRWADHTPEIKSLPEKAAQDMSTVQLALAAAEQLPQVDPQLQRAIKTAVAVCGAVKSPTQWQNALAKFALGPAAPTDGTMLPAAQIPQGQGTPQAVAQMQQQMPLVAPAVDPAQQLSAAITPQAKPMPMGGGANTPTNNPIGLFSGLSTTPGKVDGNSAFGTRKTAWRNYFGV